jgi:hypothetical protein
MICFRIVARVGCTRCLVTGIPDEWSPPPLGVCTEPGLQTIWPISNITLVLARFSPFEAK